MKIAIDARSIGYKPSGVGMYACYYIKELLKSDWEVVLLTDVIVSDDIRSFRKEGVKIISYGKAVYQSMEVLNYFRFVSRQLRMLQPDIFWEPNVLIPNDLTGYKGQVMTTVHDIFPITHGDYFDWKYRVYFWTALWWTLRKADIVTFNSKETGRRVMAAFPFVKKKKHHILYAIIPRVCYQREKSQDHNYILYVGNMEKRKGVDLLLDAYEEYRKRGGQMGLVLAGKSRERDIDDKIARMTARYDSVDYRGYIGDAEKRKLYEECACFVFPSMAEGFGICVVEAMNYYKPIIVSDLSIFKEIVGDCICYFSLEGGREKQISNLCESMFHYNYKVVQDDYDKVIEKYTFERLGQQFLKVIEQRDYKERTA